MKAGVKRYGGLQLLIVLFYCTFNGCTTNRPVQPVVVEKKEIAETVNDSANVQTNIGDFLHWYKINYQRANAFPLLVKDKAGYFAVSTKAYTNYLDFLNSSSFIAPQYLGHWQKFFIDKESEVKKSKIRSDIPDGFDYDLVLITQEPEIILGLIDSLHYKITSMSDSMALVGVTLPSDSSIAYEFEMYKGKRGWQIGYISTPNYD